jgi:hypothetical protein
MNQTTSASAASTPAIALSAAETAVLQAASNAVQVATRVWLTNLVVQAAPAAPAAALSTPTARASAAGVGVVMTGASTNGTQAGTRFRLQNQPLARIYHDCIEQRSGESVRRLDITQPNENATHRFFCDRL